jgi:hypothetical protein
MPVKHILANSTEVASRTIASGGKMHYELLKLDADGPEGSWLRSIDKLLSAGSVSIGAIVVEGPHLHPSRVQRFQHVHGHTFYRLDDHDNRRFINVRGWDGYSPAGTFAPLDRLAMRGRSELEEELF